MTSLFRDLDRYGSRTAVIADGGEAVTYRALLARADAVGRCITSRDLAIVVCRNTIDCLAGYLGILRADGVPLLLHHSTRAEQLTELTARFRPRHVYAADGEGRYQLHDGSIDPCKPGDVQADLALLLPTSGTTGSRNVVRLSKRNIVANAKSIIESLEISDGDRPITTMPMSYAYGLSILHSHLLAGASTVLTEHPLISPDFWRSMRSSEVTTFGGVPFIYETLRKLRFGDMDLPHLRYLTQAGGRLATGTTELFLEAAARKGWRFFTMYGQTEATSRIAYVPFDAARAKLGSIGVAIPGVTLGLIDDLGHAIDEPEQEGELTCRGDNVSMGYASDAEDLARPDDNHGLLSTGDIARRDKDGYYNIVGRKKRIVKLFGHRVNLDEMEDVLRGADHDCACAGRDDLLKIFVAGGEAARVRADVATLTGLHRQGIEVVPVSTIFRSESGKVDYARLETHAP